MLRNAIERVGRVLFRHALNTTADYLEASKSLTLG